MLFNIFVTFAVVSITLYYDAQLRLRYLFFPKTLEKWIPHATKRVPELFFAIMKSFYNSRFLHENPDLELPERFLLVVNHQSLMDIPIVFYWYAHRKIRFISKKELGRWVPLVSQVLRYQKHGLIDRKHSHSEAMQNIENLALRSPKEDLCPTIFPEGTRSKDGRVKKFFTGGTRRILDISPMPVVALAMDGGWKLRDVVGLFKNARNSIFHMKVVKVFESPKSRAEGKQILEEAEQLIRAQVEIWHAQEA